jgi:integrase/recombinase XerC
MFTEFKNYLRNEKRYSQHTVTAYCNDIEEYELYCQINYQTNACAADSYILRSWLAQMIDRGILPQSVKRKLSSINKYYKFLILQKHITNNPVNKVKTPKAAKRLPVFITESNMQQLFIKDIFSNDFSGLRDKLLIEIFYSCGVRLNEIIHLKTAYISKNSIKVTGKRNKERIIPIHNNLYQTIRQYLEIKEKKYPNSCNEYLLITDSGKKLYEKFVYRKIKYYLALVSSVNKKSPHILRHTFATHLLNKGADINAVKELLGHSSLAATQVYTHNTIDKLKTIYNQAHPLGG